MTRAFNRVPAPLTSQLQARRDDWVRRVTALVDQITQWSTEAGWQVEKGDESLAEELLGLLRAMRFHFDASQSYKLRAIEAVADLFRGQPKVAMDFASFEACRS